MRARVAVSAGPLLMAACLLASGPPAVAASLELPLLAVERVDPGQATATLDVPYTTGGQPLAASDVDLRVDGRAQAASLTRLLPDDLQIVIVLDVGIPPEELAVWVGAVREFVLGLPSRALVGLATAPATLPAGPDRAAVLSALAGISAQTPAPGGAGEAVLAAVRGLTAVPAERALVLAGTSTSFAPSQELRDAVRVARVRVFGCRTDPRDALLPELAGSTSGWEGLVPLQGSPVACFDELLGHALGRYQLRLAVPITAAVVSVRLAQGPPLVGVVPAVAEAAAPADGDGRTQLVLAVALGLALVGTALACRTLTRRR